MSGPYSKEQQLARGERRYRRKVAGPKQWAAVMAEKQGPCLICERLGVRVLPPYGMDFHHLVPRARGGDDVAENIVPLCSLHHHDVTVRNVHALHALRLMLNESERAYCEAKMGAEWRVRLFGSEG